MNEIDSFPTEKDYLDFDFILTKKLFNEKIIRHVSFVKTGELKIDSRDYEDLGCQLYECTECGQLWALRDPDHSNRGFFIRTAPDKVDFDKKQRSKIKNVGCLTLIVTMIILIALLKIT